MTTNAPDDPSLDARLAALPRDVPPPRDLWPAIDAAIRPRPATRSRPWPHALAAGIAVAAVGAIVASRLGREPALVAPGLPAGTATSLVAARLGVPDDPDFRATRAALEQTYRERLALLAPETRARIEDDLAVIRHANEDIRRALARDPGSPVLMELLESTTEQELNLYATVGRSTDPFAPRTRT